MLASRMVIHSGFFAALLLVLGSTAFADRAKKPNAPSTLANVCPKIREVGSDLFWKNNKPIRASSAFAAPVIGYNKVMTLAYIRGSQISGKSFVLYARNGHPLASFTPYPCRPDHCAGRVVSSTLTATARRAAIAASGSPEGYLRINPKLCIHLRDIGSCYNAQVRGPCAGIVK